jgi:hypothetical protein
MPSPAAGEPAHWPRSGTKSIGESRGGWHGSFLKVRRWMQVEKQRNKDTQQKGRRVFDVHWQDQGISIITFSIHHFPYARSADWIDRFRGVTRLVPKWILADIWSFTELGLVSKRDLCPSYVVGRCNIHPCYLITWTHRR